MYQDYIPKNGVPQSGETGNLWKKILSYLIYLLFWVVLTATSLWLMFETREVIVELMIFAQLNPWAVRGFDRWIIFLLGLIWFVTLIWTEHYLRSGIDKKRLWRNIATIAAAQAILAVIVYGIYFFISYISSVI